MIIKTLHSLAFCLLLCTLAQAEITVDSISVINNYCSDNMGEITIHATSSFPPLEYSLDGLIWQQDNVFDNLAAGDYLTFIRDQNNCMEVTTSQIAQYDGTPLISLGTINICSDEYFVIGADTLTTTGTHVVVAGTTTQNCDSLISIDLVVHQTAEIEMEYTLCEGDTLMFRGEILDESGVYSFIGPHPYGCDSTYTVNLSILTNCNPDKLALTATGNICRQLILSADIPGATNYQWSRNGQVLIGEHNSTLVLDQSLPEVEGTYEASFFLDNERRTSETYEVSIPIYITDLGEEVICEGDIFEYGDFEISTSGTFQIDTLASDGCDSIIQIEVVVIDCDDSCLINIPDQKFLDALLSDGVDVDGDGQLSCMEAEVRKSLTIMDSDISDLSGLEAFLNLESLLASGNNLDQVDLSLNSNLIILDLSDNNLSMLDLSENINLEQINVNNNRLSHLDVTSCSFLDQISCESNALETLYLKNGSLESLINLAGNPDLRHICADDAQVPELIQLVDDLNLSAEVSTVCMLTSVTTLSEDKLSIYPNPADDLVTLRAASPIHEVRIYSVDGSRVYQRQLTDNSTVLSIDVSALPRGVLVCEVLTAEGRGSVKVVR